jgi:hypothetical protein
MRQGDTPIFQVDPAYQSLIRAVGLDAEAVFTDPRINIWRSLPDRENCTLDQTLPDGQLVRLHIKRYPAGSRSLTPAEVEVRGYRLLADANIPAAPIIAHGRMTDGRSFVILQDLAGYTPGDKLLRQGTSFERLLTATADLAAMLHAHGLHHRDLYLCHFMAKLDGDNIDVKLIDPARVQRLGNVFTRRRWIVKDLAQFWFSTLSLAITSEQRHRWLERYATQRNISPRIYRSAIERKAQAIARHDTRLNRRQPDRNVSIPVSS